MYSTDPRLRRQLACLDRFLVAHADKFALMKYLPWTNGTPMATKIRLAPSIQLPGMLGVFPQGEQVRKPGWIVATYPGMLMWEELHEAFNDLYHCPTAVRVDVLDYEVDDEATAKAMKIQPDDDGRYIARMSIIGDPTHAGSILNSPHGLGIEPNCLLGSATKKELNRYISKRKDGKFAVHSDVVNIRLRDDYYLEHSVSLIELLVMYDSSDSRTARCGASDFWSKSKYSNSYCTICFGRGTAENRLQRVSESIFKHAQCGRTPAPVSQLRRLTMSAQQLSPCQSNAAPVGALRSLTAKCQQLSPYQAISRPCRSERRSPKLIGALATRLDQSTKSTLSVRVPSSLLPPAPPPSPSPVPSLVRTSSVVSATATDREEPDDYDSDSSVEFEDHQPLVQDVSDTDSANDSDDSIESDSPDDHRSLATTRTTSSSSSSSSISSRPKLSIKSNEPKVQPTTLTDAGRVELRKVWSRYRPLITKMAKQKKANWVWHLPKDDAAAEDKQHKKLLAAFDSVKQCCGRPSVLHDADANPAAVDSPWAFLEARFDWQSRYDYCKKAQQRTINDLLSQTPESSTRRTTWQQLPLCDGCLCAAIGWGRSTMYQKTRPDGGAVRIPGARTLAILTHIVAGLLDLTSRLGQTLPTSQGKGRSGHCSHRVLPFHTKAQAIEALQDLLNATHRRENPDAPNRIKVAATTFTRAVAWIQRHRSITLNIKKTKQLAKCKHCVMHSFAIQEARQVANATAKSEAKRKFDEHNKQWQRQRGHFELQKLTSLQEPWNLMTLTLDGMDQAKTQLPHHCRKAKSSFAEQLVKMRLSGVFGFGANIPCMGVSAAPNVKAKGANAFFGLVEMVLDANFRSMNTDVYAPIPGQQFDFALEEPTRPPADSPCGIDLIDPVERRSLLVDPIAAADSGPVPMEVDSDESKESDLASSSPQPNKSSRPTVESNPRNRPQKGDPGVDFWEGTGGPKPAFMWPKTLHFTFDNTTADGKNTSTFRGFAHLVAAGVFMEITVSTLMVGHTHDIVDQMFSVWSRQLDQSDAHTLPAMQQLFRSKYKSKIYEMKNLGRNLESASVADSETASTVSIDSQVADRLVQVASRLGIRPHMMEQTSVPNIDAWWSTPKLQGVTAPHMFLLKKGPSADGKTESVYMYCKHLVDSHEDTSVNHDPRWGDPNELTGGPYTTRITMIADVNKIPGRDPEMPKDPLLCPPVLFDTKPIRDCLNEHRQQKSMTPEELEWFESWLKKMDEDYSKFTSTCDTCKRICEGLAKIGPISHSDRLSEEEQQQEKKKSKEKRKLEKERKEHLASADFGKVHAAALDSNGFWSKWIDRVDKVIRPYYLARGLISAPTPAQREETGRVPHPVQLPKDRKDPGLYDVRVDVECEQKQGPPKVGDWILVRSKEAQYPVWVGKVTGCRWAGSTSDEPSANTAVAASPPAPAATCAAAAASTPSPAAPAAPTRSTRAAAVNGTKRRIESAALADAEVDEEDDDDDDAASQHGESSDDDEPDEPMTSDDDLEPLSNLVADPTSKADQSVKPPCRKRARKSNDTDSNDAQPSAQSKKATRQQSKKATQSKATSKKQAAAAAKSTPKSTVNQKTAPESTLPPPEATTKSGESTRKSNAQGRAPSGDYVEVRWYDYEKSEATAHIDPTGTVPSMHRWKQFAQQLGEDVYRQWNSVVAMYRNEEACPIPVELFRKWKSIVFHSMPPNAPDSTGIASRESCIVWGSGSKVMTKKGAGVTFSAAAWTRLECDISYVGRKLNNTTLHQQFLANAPPHVLAEATRALTVVTELSTR